ncbi:hypothetical protein FOA52_007776 [Chlamydomonas sp. UWO 241]|nr:hypothetical protein FOA52_007776 [Chlamydomonas sp. UWO 241]
MHAHGQNAKVHGSAFLHEALAQLLNELSHGDALQHAARAVELAPQWIAARATLAHASRNFGHLNQAAEQLRHALALTRGGGGDEEAAEELLVELREVAALKEAALARDVGLPALRVAQQLLPEVAPGGDGAGPGIKVWECGSVLAALLVSSPELRGLLRGVTVLELGSGTGISGLAAAHLGAHVWLTDLPDALPHLAANARSNADGVAAAGGAAHVGALDWCRLVKGAGGAGAGGRGVSIDASRVPGCLEGVGGDAGGVGAGAADTTAAGGGGATSSDGGGLQLVLGADLVYSARQARPVARALAALLSAHRASCPFALLAHKSRLRLRGAHEQT